MNQISSLRILLVNSYHYYGGGDSTYSFNLANLLSENGHSVAFFAMQDERNIPDPNSDLFVSHIDFKELNESKSIANGIKVLTRVIYLPEARKKFSLLLDRFSPDIVHLQNYLGHLSPSIIFEAEKRKIPMIWTLHDYKLICPNSHLRLDTTGEICEACRGGKFYQPIIKRCKKGSILASSMASIEAYAHRIMKIRERINAFIAPSNFLRTKLIENGFTSSLIYHLPHFINEVQFDLQNIEGKYLLFLGRLTKIKGIDTLLEASKLIPDINIRLAGRIDEVLEKSITELKLRNVEYLGTLQGQELKELLTNATALVVPSIWYENQPFSILEAFASGKPVIASNLGGMKELVVHRERGLLVPPGDADALAEAMQWLFNSPQEIERMGYNAYKYALTYHHPNVHYQNLMEIYRKLT